MDYRKLTNEELTKELKRRVPEANHIIVNDENRERYIDYLEKWDKIYGEVDIDEEIAKLLNHYFPTIRFNPVTDITRPILLAIIKNHLTKGGKNE